MGTGSNSGEILPGDWAAVIDGTFAGHAGEVVSFAQARSLWGKAGGEQPPLKPATGSVWVVLTIFGRRTPVSFAASQLQKAIEP
jgi:transcription antitermination factor NusG